MGEPTQFNRRTFLRNTFAGAVSLASAAALTEPAQAHRERRQDTQKRITVHSGRPAQVDSATLFAMDNVSIPFSANLALQMHTATKHPQNPVLRRGDKGTLDDYRAQFYGT